MTYLDKNGLQAVTNKLIQGETIKVVSHRGHTVKNVIDSITRECENAATPNTMNLENRINKFKIGKGRDVDVSEDVEEGKVEVELKGKTYQNLVEYIADYEGYEKNGSYYNKNASRKLSFGLKPNTVYTRILDVKECFEPFWMYDSINNSDGTYRQYSYRIKQGLVINKFTSSDLGTINSYIFNPDQNVTKKENFNIVVGKMILLEGDYTQTPIEELPKYFEGIKSSFEDGVVDVEVQGKNIIDAYSNLSIGMIMDNNNISHNTAWVYTEDLFTIKPDTTYNISEKLQNYKQYRFIFFDSNKNFIGLHYINGGTNTKFITPCDAYYFRLNYSVNVNGNWISRPELQIEEGSNPTPYTPYYKKKISFNIGEPLRSLPNGVCDEIRNNNGQWELVRRTAKVILNGSENWDNSYSGWNNKVFCCPNNYLPNIKYAPTTVSNVLSTLLPPVNIATLCSKLGYTGICTHAWHLSWLQVAKNGIETVEQLKSWLSQNPTTVYYELQSPIITPIKPMDFDVKPLATMTINSEIAPISNHKVVLNRAGQIEQGIVQIAELKKRVDSLEIAYDSYLLETQHKLSLLGFEYQLESEEI